MSKQEKSAEFKNDGHHVVQFSKIFAQVFSLSNKAMCQVLLVSTCLLHTTDEAHIADRCLSVIMVICSEDQFAGMQRLIESSKTF